MAPTLQTLLRRLIDDTTDNFGRVTIGELTDLINVSGERDFTPERLRYYKDGTRRFIQYGTDANFSETEAGHLLAPDAGQTLTLETAERAQYPVGIDFWPSMAREVNGELQSGDAIGGGYGVIDLANFNPGTVTWDGTTADGYFWIHTADTGLDEVYLVGVRSGTVFDSFRTGLATAASVLTIIEQRLNCYDVGPSVFRETYTDIADRTEPQQNDILGSVANDDGKGSELFSHRMTWSIHQAAGNSGLELEAGSVAMRASSDPAYDFKKKGHGMTFEVTDATADTYQVVGAIRGENARPEIALQISNVDISSTPGSGVTDTEVLLIAVDDSETNVDAETFTTPPEHNPENSVVRVYQDDAGNGTITGPVQDGAGTDVSGPDTANTMTNPGGYQLGRQAVDSEGVGSGENVTRSPEPGERQVHDTDLCLILADCASTGTLRCDFQTAQNS